MRKSKSLSMPRATDSPTENPLQRFIAKHPRIFPILLVLLFIYTGIGVLLVGFGHIPPVFFTIRVGLLVAFALGLFFFRKSRPWILFWLAILSIFTGLYTDKEAVIQDRLPSAISTNQSGLELLFILFAMYFLAAYRPVKQAVLGFCLFLAALAILAWQPEFFEQFGAPTTDFKEVYSPAVMVLAFTVIGIAVSIRRQYLFELTEKNNRIIIEQAQQYRISSAEERRRIAREMHDIVSHSLTVMIALADGSAATLNRDPSRSKELLETLSETGRDALGEMRRMLGLLQDTNSEDDRNPQPRANKMDHLIDLVDRFRKAGLRLQMLSDGTPHTDQGLEVAIYQIAQEGLTNVLRHAPTANEVTLKISHQPDSVKIEISNSYSDKKSASTGANRGIIGIRERVAMFNGTVSCEVPVDGGWIMRVVLFPKKENIND